MDSKNCDEGPSVGSAKRSSSTAKPVVASGPMTDNHCSRARPVTPKPLHDWTSHAADAFRYLAMAVNNVVSTGVKPPEAPAPQLSLPTFDEMLAKQRESML